MSLTSSPLRYPGGKAKLFPFFASLIEANQLAYIGNVNGMPVYMERARLSPPLENLGPNSDLSRAVTDSKDVFKALEGVNMVYVPTQTTGCTFQPLQFQEPVRK